MCQRDCSRLASTLIETLVVVAIVGILISLTLPAVQKVRDISLRSQCAHNLKQIGLAVHQYHDVKSWLPSGMRFQNGLDANLWSSWLTQILPHLEQGALWNDTEQAYLRCPNPFLNPPHIGLATVIPTFVCPADGRAFEPEIAARDNVRVALTSYLGVEGTDLYALGGVLFRDSRIRLSQILDGTSQTLLAGERPPSADFQFGWWYAGTGQVQTGSADMFMGVTELNVLPYSAAPCPPGPYEYSPGSLGNQCDMFHFWSLHDGGAQFVFADGSVHFLPYSAVSSLPALATRAAGDIPASFE